jgi:hypothetical protein
MVPNTKLWARSIKRLYHQFHVPVQKEWGRVTVLVAKIDNAVYSTAVVTRRPLLNEIADINNVRVRRHWDRHPALSRRVKHLKTLRSWLLKQEGYPTKVCMRAS